MIKVTITGIAETISKYQQLAQDIQDKALLSAINKTAIQTKNLATRLIRKGYLVKASNLKDKILIKRASKNRLEAQVISIKKGGGILLTDYSVRMTKKGMSVKVKKSGGRKIIPDAFIGQGKPFQRYGERNYTPRKGYWAGKTIKRGERAGQPILRQKTKILYGPSIADLMGSGNIYNELVKFSQEKLIQIFKNELKFYTDRMKR